MGSISIQDPSMWNIGTAGVTEYEEWVCRLVSCMIMDCYCEQGSLTESLAASSSSVSVLSSHFFQSFLHLSSIKSDIAELLFPLICFDVISSLGTDHEFISYMISNVLLSQKTNQEVPQATRLGIRTIIFILKEDVSKFVEKPFLQAKSTSSGRKRKPLESSKMANIFSGNKQILPFSISLQIDFFFAAKVINNQRMLISLLLYLKSHGLLTISPLFHAGCSPVWECHLGNDVF